MENPSEVHRLETKSDSDTTREQLQATGILNLPGDTIQLADAGCGTGIVGRAMAALCLPKYRQVSLNLLDASTERLAEAAKQLPVHSQLNVKSHLCELEKISLPDNVLDFAFCRFVFEYVEDKNAVLQELIRATKPGGKVVVGDLDYNSITHYPLTPQLEKQMLEVVQALQTNRWVDPYAGRKLYTMFYDHGLQNIKVHIFAHHVFYGALREKDRVNWTAKLDQIIAAHNGGKFKLSFDPEPFKERFLQFLADPRRFSYTPIILVEGIKP